MSECQRSFLRQYLYCKQDPNYEFILHQYFAKLSNYLSGKRLPKCLATKFCHKKC